MKRILIAIVLLAGLGPAPAAAAAKVRVVATLSDLASIAEAVGGERVEVRSIAEGKQDPHAVEILPSYMLMLKKADLFLKVGMDLELWSRGIVSGARNPDLHIVDCSTGIGVLERPTTPVDAGMGDIHVGGNPHYWLDPRNGKVIARNVADGLIRVDPEGAATYEERLALFEARIDEKMDEWTAAMEPYRGTQVVFFHNSWPYFCRAFGLEAAGFIEPKPGVSPSPGHTANVIRLIRARGIEVIAMSPYFDRKASESVARQSGATLVVLASSVGGVEGADDYLSLFDANLRRLREALGEP